LAIAASFFRRPGSHPAHRVRPAAVARLDEEEAVIAQECLLHRHEPAVGQHEGGIGAQLLDEAEDVVPAPAVEARGVLAQLPQDLVHLERGEDSLDQHRRADRPARRPSASCTGRRRSSRASRRLSIFK
jgi:hypothetical protein